jgi:hypothetical protein
MPKMPLEALEGFTLQVGISISHLWEVEFHYILGQLSIAEEAAIGQITPLISLVKLKNGNLGRKGFVTCIQQSSNLNKILLPNLPQQCKFLVFQRRRGDGSMQSFTARRPWIQRALEMYWHISRDIHAWEIKIDESHLQQWPENNNLLNLVESITNETVSDSPTGDENVLGPAPFQNVDDPDEIFVGTTLAKSDDNLKRRIDDATRALEDFAIIVEDDKAQMQQKEALPTGSFESMQQTEYAWALAFPNLFPPTYVNDKWVMLGDLKGPPFSGFRDRKVPVAEWAKWMMWTSNGRVAKHPFFALVLLNSELTRTSLQSQGRATLARNAIPGDMTIEAFREQWKTKKGKQSIRNALNYGAGNVHGTSQYWGNANRQLKATALYHEYVNQLQMRYFHTQSNAEFHDPFLCLLLYRYVRQIESEEEGTVEILEDDAAFHKAVGDYKNAVTHFFSFKKESWLPTVLHIVFYIDHYSDVNEFAKGWGAIHGHGTGYANTAVDQKIDDALVKLGIDSYRALKVIDKFIDEHPKAHQPLEDDEEPNHPFETLGNEGMDARRHFLSQSHDGSEILKLTPNSRSSNVQLPRTSRMKWRINLATVPPTSARLRVTGSNQGANQALAIVKLVWI